MNPFRVGDVIICVDNTNKELCLTIGRYYTVLELYSNYGLFLMDDSNRYNSFFNFRFRIPNENYCKRIGVI